jgi:hypothetical protein
MAVGRIAGVSQILLLLAFFPRAANEKEKRKAKEELREAAKQVIKAKRSK